jgi:hypothetical protein
MTVVHHNGNAPFSSVRKTDVLTFKLMVQIKSFLGHQPSYSTHFNFKSKPSFYIDRMHII